MFEYKKMREIELTHELNLFYTHLQNNSRTILSAAFGNGKTTFLKQFQEKYSEYGEFITLHPVNYSCGSTEDVFEYIKRDILLQLAQLNLLEKIDLSAVDNSLFTWNNIKDVISFLLSFTPAGNTASKLFDKISSLCEKANSIKDDYDEKKITWEKYSNLFENQRGGLYEHDLYTALIERSLEVIHTRERRNRSTLIIEDMDRIDPAHLFRILNVLGAHLDTGTEGSNKFGFKNIVLVLDYETTEHIFHHFYGDKANYSGYMNKFISHNVFHFDIMEAARKEFWSMLTARCDVEESFLKSILISGTKTRDTDYLGAAINRLSIRGIAQIMDGLDSQINSQSLDANGYPISNIAPITILLSVLVRLNMSINYDVLFKCISQNFNGLKLLQQYLLFSTPIAHSLPFNIGRNKVFKVSIKKVIDGKYTISIDGVNLYSPSQVDTEKELRKCFDMAVANVNI